MRVCQFRHEPSGRRRQVVGNLSSLPFASGPSTRSRTASFVVLPTVLQKNTTLRGEIRWFFTTLLEYNHRSTRPGNFAC